MFNHKTASLATYIIINLQQNLEIIVISNDIRAFNMIVCWHHLLFQFSNVEFPNLAIYFDAAKVTFKRKNLVIYIYM
jgi:hypothetical protein